MQAIEGYVDSLQRENPAASGYASTSSYKVLELTTRFISFKRSIISLFTFDTLLFIVYN